MKEKFSPEEASRKALHVGDSITIGERSYEIITIRSASDVGRGFGLTIRRSVPVYYLDGISIQSKGAYHPEQDIVLVFTNTDDDTLHHELTHVVEYHQEASSELLELYERVKRVVTEDSFEGEFVSWNFRKHIHEFIADGRTKPAFIAALKKERLYEDFVRVTAYLFV